MTYPLYLTLFSSGCLSFSRLFDYIIIILGGDFITFGQKIEYRCKELGFTQAELAEKLKSTQPYISRLESGHFNPSMRMIAGIATVLDISVDYLLFDDRKAI